jgi:hypothetical protein
MKLSEALSVLGVPHASSQDEIRAAYKKKVLEVHPDHGGTAQDFIRVRAAYEILCNFYSAHKEADDTPIPDDLRRLIDDIVLEFMRQFDRIESACAACFDTLRCEMRVHIQGASRSELKEFNETFRTAWNKHVRDLFATFNEECQYCIRKYEAWFDKTAEQIADEKYRSELRAYAKSPRLYVYGCGLLFAGVVLSTLYGGAWDPVGSFKHVCLVVGPLTALPAVYWLDCKLRRYFTKSPERLSVQPFILEDAAEFQGSAILKRGSANTRTMAAGGLLVGDLLSRGIGVPLVGAAAGWLMGATIDRLVNPTDEIRKMIAEEFEQFVDSAAPEITEQAKRQEQQLLHEIREQVVANYERKVAELVRLLAER